MCWFWFFVATCCFAVWCHFCIRLFCFAFRLQERPNTPTYGHAYVCWVVMGEADPRRATKNAETQRHRLPPSNTLCWDALWRVLISMLIGSWSYRTDGLKSANKMQHQGKPRIGNMLLFISSLRVVYVLRLHEFNSQRSGVWWKMLCSFFSAYKCLIRHHCI